MKKVIAILAVGVGLIIGSAQAQPAPRVALAEKLLTLMKMESTIEKSFAAVKQMMPAQMEKMRQATGGSSDRAAKVMPRVNEMMDMMAREFSWENLKDGYIALYADVFTEDELKGLIAFYETPVGQAFVQKQPELTQRTMALTQEIILKVMPKIQAMKKNK